MTLRKYGFAVTFIRAIVATKIDKLSHGARSRALRDLQSVFDDPVLPDREQALGIVPVAALFCRRNDQFQTFSNPCLALEFAEKRWPEREIKSALGRFNCLLVKIFRHK